MAHPSSNRNVKGPFEFSSVTLAEKRRRDLYNNLGKGKSSIFPAAKPTGLVKESCVHLLIKPE